MLLADASPIDLESQTRTVEIVRLSGMSQPVNHLSHPCPTRLLAGMRVVSHYDASLLPRQHPGSRKAIRGASPSSG